jgi:hypothetical protein
MGGSGGKKKSWDEASDEAAFDESSGQWAAMLVL